MPPEDVYLYFLPPQLRMVVAFGIILLLGAVLASVLLAWIFSRTRRDD
jgi:hypothetical protein